jgi:PHD/YefM family antitoxin component YafN of YafNO toxin-antitoxin module
MTASAQWNQDEVIPASEARRLLHPILDQIRAGSAEPVIFGNHRKPEAVIVPFTEYMALRALADEVLADRAFQLEVARRLSDGADVPVMSAQAFDAEFDLDRPAANGG